MSFSYTVGEPLVTIDTVSVSYDGNNVLDGVSAVIPDIKQAGAVRGQIVCLVGPSGCGKTTLFRTIAGLLTPDSGSVTLGASGKPVEAGEVGVVAQSYPLMAYRRVRGNLVYAGKRAGMKTADALKVADEYLEEFNLTEHANKFPHQLSGGQRQRVAIAQQLICSKHFIILDEPFSGLDEVAKRKTIRLLTKVANRDDENTLIIITHDVSAAVAVADIIWLMGRNRDADGKIIPGAKILDCVNLIDLNIAWYDQPLKQPGAQTLVDNIKDRLEIL